MNALVEQSRIRNAANAWTDAITRLVKLQQNNPFAIFGYGSLLKDEVMEFILLAVDYPNERNVHLNQAEVLQSQLDAYLTEKELS